MKLRQALVFVFFVFLCRRTIIRPPNHTVNGNTNIVRISQSYFYVRFYVFSHIKTCRKKTATVNQQNERARLYGRAAISTALLQGTRHNVWNSRPRAIRLNYCCVVTGAMNMHHRDEKPLSEGVLRVCRRWRSITVSYHSCRIWFKAPRVKMSAS